MRHGMDHRKLRRNPGHRKALLRNLMNALVRSERIETTVAKAKELRRLADRLITLGKRNTTHARRMAFRLLSDKGNTEKLFSGLAGRFAERAGGYTRIVRTGFRAGDGSEMALLEYLPAEEKKAAVRGGKKAAGAPKKKTPAGKTAAKGKKAGAEVPKVRTRRGEKAEGTRSDSSKGKSASEKAPTGKGEAKSPSRKRKPEGDR